MGDFRSQGITQGINTILQSTNKMIQKKIWGSKNEQMQDAFGQFFEQAKEELNTFKRQEDYLESVYDAHTGLI